MRAVSFMLPALLPLVLAAPQLVAQTTDCEPVARRAGREFGCFILARQELGHLTDRPLLYWHLDTFPTREAALSAAGPRSTVVESLGHTWLYTLAESAWHAQGGTHVAAIGPLPVIPAKAHAAVYMEGVFKPGMQTRPHRHPGVEAWYTLTGSMCLETSEGTLNQNAGEPGVMANAGLAMVLTGTGTGVRRSVVLILQDSAEPRSTVAHDWIPKGLCTVTR